MSVAGVKVTSTLQVEFDGERLTAHYEEENGRMELQKISSNLDHVRVELVTHLCLLMQAFERSR